MFMPQLLAPKAWSLKCRQVNITLTAIQTYSELAAQWSPGFRLKVAL